MGRPLRYHDEHKEMEGEECQADSVVEVSQSNLTTSFSTLQAIFRTLGVQYRIFFYIYTCTLNFPHVGCKPRPRDYYVVRPSTATSKISSYPVLSASVAERGEKLRGELIPVVTTYVWKEVPCLHDNMSSNYLSTACAQLQEPVCLHVCMQIYSEAGGWGGGNNSVSP